MTESVTISCLTRILEDLKLHQPSVSLRMWFEEGRLKFWLSNLPPRHKKPVENRKNLTLAWKQSLDDNKPPPSMVKSRGRGRRSEGKSTLSYQSTQTEQLKISGQSSDPPPVKEEDESTIHLSVPCSNSFEALINLDTKGDDNDSAAKSNAKLISTLSMRNEPQSVPTYSCRLCSKPFNQLNDDSTKSSPHQCYNCEENMKNPDLQFYRCSCPQDAHLCDFCLPMIHDEN